MSIVMHSELIPPDSNSGALGRYPVESIEGLGGRAATLETLWSFFIDMVNDPDGALQKDPGSLEKIMRHPRVSAAMNLREQNVASMMTTIKAPKKPLHPALALAAAEYVDSVWDSLDNKDALFQQMQASVLHGGVGHEWTWEKLSDGTQRPIAFTPIHKTRFTFTREGELCLRTRQQMVWGGYLGMIPSDPSKAPTHGTALPIGKFSYHVYERVPGSWFKPDDEGFIYYGRGEDEDLFDVVIRDLGTWYLEQLWLGQYGVPPRILYHPNPVAQWEDAIKQFAQRLRTESLIPLFGSMSDNKRMFELVNAEVPNPTTDAFGAARTRHYNDIEAILLGAEGALSQQDKGGYSAHKSRQQSGPDKLASRDAGRISSTLNTQIVPAILRYGPEEFRTLDRRDRPKILLYNEEDVDADTIGKAADLVPVPKKYIYRQLKIDEPQEGEETVFTGGNADPYTDLEELNDGKDPAESGRTPKKAIGEDDE